MQKRNEKGIKMCHLQKKNQVNRKEGSNRGNEWQKKLWDIYRSPHTTKKNKPRSPQLEKARVQQRSPNAAKNKNK